jgi:hypothetical protein
LANTTFRVEFFANTTADASSYGQGQTYTTVSTDANGNASFTASLDNSVPLGQLMKARTGNASAASQLSGWM